VASADARSRAAWTPGPGDTITVRLWDVRAHPTDGRASLVIVDGTESHLSDEEKEKLIQILPSDWNDEET